MLERINQGFGGLLNEFPVEILSAYSVLTQPLGAAASAERPKQQRKKWRRQSWLRREPPLRKQMKPP